MSQEQSDLAKQFFSPVYILQLLVLVGTMAMGYGSLNTRVSTLETLRAEDQNRLERSIDEIKSDLKMLVDRELNRNNNRNIL